MAVFGLGKQLGQLFLLTRLAPPFSLSAKLPHNGTIVCVMSRSLVTCAVLTRARWLIVMGTVRYDGTT